MALNKTAGMATTSYLSSVITVALKAKATTTATTTTATATATTRTEEGKKP